MSARIATRSYVPTDRDAVLAIFDGNADTFFARGDREWLEETLVAPDGPAFVIAVDHSVAAFGGYELSPHYNRALLFWGMADRRLHRVGLGRLLLFERLLHVFLRAEPATRYVTVDTSPAVAPFFRRWGFEETATWPEGYRSGMTMHELRYDLAKVDRAMLVAERDAAMTAVRSAIDRG